MPRVGFEPTISAGERPKTYALDRAAKIRWPLSSSISTLYNVSLFKRHTILRRHDTNELGLNNCCRGDCALHRTIYLLGV